MKRRSPVYNTETERELGFVTDEARRKRDLTQTDVATLWTHAAAGSNPTWHRKECFTEIKRRANAGEYVSDWMRAGLDDLADDIENGNKVIPMSARDQTMPGEPTGRHIVLTPASTIKPRPVRWLWRDRMPLGELALLAGRENIGKSTVAYTLAAWVTTGTMKGEFYGQPRAVIVAATEDSWEHTIVPRLMAAGADLDLVYRVDVVTSDGFGGTLTLPSDIGEMKRVIEMVDAAFVLLDPLMSRLSASLDTHKDADVRVALEPLVSLAHDARIAVLGIIHVNKGSSVDPLNAIMGSRAFPAVSRAVLVAMKDPEDETRVLLGLPKSNLGPSDLPTFVYRIVSELVASTDEGAIFTGKVVWLDETNRSVAEAMAAVGEGPEAATATSECADWLNDYLESSGGRMDSATVKAAAKAEGHTDRALRAARARLRVLTESFGFPRRTFWVLPGTSRDAPPGETVLTDTTDTTVSDLGFSNGHLSPSRDSRDSRAPSPVRTDMTGEVQVNFDTLPLVTTRSNGIGSGVGVDEFSERQR